MATKTVAWNSGSGVITLTYTGQGNGSVSVKSDANDSFDERSQNLNIVTTEGSPEKAVQVLVKQAGKLLGWTTKDFGYTGSVQEVTLPKGRYKLQCWGAQGGNVTGTYAATGSNGGYSEGVITLIETTTLYIFVGGKGTDYISSASQTDTTVLNGGWNGGGAGVRTSRYSSGGEDGRSFPRSGGGATDIATVTSSMGYSNGRTNRTSASLLSRIIVAGGGAGASARYTEKETTTADWAKVADITTDTAYTNSNGNTLHYKRIYKRPEVQLLKTLDNYFIAGSAGTVTAYSGYAIKVFNISGLSEITIKGTNMTPKVDNPRAYAFYADEALTVKVGDAGEQIPMTSYEYNLQVPSGANYLGCTINKGRNGAVNIFTEGEELFKAGKTYKVEGSISGYIQGKAEVYYYKDGVLTAGNTNLYNEDGYFTFNNSYEDYEYVEFGVFYSSNYGSVTLSLYTGEPTTSTESSNSRSSSSHQGGGTSGKGTYGGSQSSAGSGGAFGLGANQTSTNYRYAAGGGGGGWYGGGTGQSDSSAGYIDYTGGGSGFVNTAANASYRPSGYTGLQLDSGSTTAGNSSHPSTNGGTEIGHSGNGYARITVL